MGFWSNVAEYLGDRFEEYANNEVYKRGFVDGYKGQPRLASLLNNEFYNAGYNDGQSARHSGVTFE